MRYLSGGACIVGGTAAYLLLMAIEVVPTAIDLAGNLGMQVSARDAWIGISAIAITVALGLGSSPSMWCVRLSILLF